MKEKDHDTIVSQTYTSPTNEHFKGKSNTKYKKHYRPNARKLLQSVQKLFDRND